jgi:hypothetical protein
LAKLQILGELMPVTFSFDDFIRSIGIALHSTHNTLTTDRPEKQPDEFHWVIDHSKEIEKLEQLEEMVVASKDTCPLCGHCNSRP